MPICPYCGKETTDPSALFCPNCGASFRAVQAGISAPQSIGAPMQSSYTSIGGLSYDTSQRYERALRRVEQLGTAVLVMSIVTLILLFV
ncbi:MAG: zinc-ribbon domain-containing protein [Nitrososphaerota archaeon]|nr:zinc-ribbon domain-containing protein [Nitrososphaerota archaeon]